MELCPGGSLSSALVARKTPYPPSTVFQLTLQMTEALEVIHRAGIIHRDIKLENFLIDSLGNLKLCDFGSATTETYEPDESWSIQQRNCIEDECAVHTTPMYRSPEMLDTWNNYPINTAVDIWALGCILYTLCFHRHPFEDSAKLRIVNGNYSIPNDPANLVYNSYFDLIRQILTVDPRLRPTAANVLEHLKLVGREQGFRSDQVVTFYEDVTDNSMYDGEEESGVGGVSGVGGAGGGGWMSSIKGGAGSLMKNIKGDFLI